MWVERGISGRKYDRLLTLLICVPFSSSHGMIVLTDFQVDENGGGC
jgi:hypothetical protein